LARAVAVQQGDAAIHRLDAARDKSCLRQRQQRAWQTTKQQQTTRGASAIHMHATRAAQPTEPQQAAKQMNVVAMRVIRVARATHSAEL